MPPIRPATGPDIRRFTGRCVADSIVAIPPEDCISCTLTLVAGRAQRLVEPGDVPRNLRPDVRVQADGREALELAVERQHLVRDRKERLRELLEHDLLDPPFVLGLEVRVEQADGDGLDSRVPQLAHALAHFVLVERDEDVAVRDGHALVDGQPVAALDERPRLPGQLLLEREVVRLLVPPDVEDVAEAVRRQHPDLCTRVGEDDVRRHGCPVQEVVHLGERDAGLRAEAADAFDHAAGRVIRRRRNLVDRDPAGLLVDEDQVGEGAADVDPDPLQAGAPASAGTISRPTSSIWSSRPFR